MHAVLTQTLCGIRHMHQQTNRMQGHTRGRGDRSGSITKRAGQGQQE